jgi:hypothetical protein
MELDETPHTITDPDGKSEAKRLVAEDELRFSILMALRDCPAFSGTPKLSRDSAKRMLADSVVRHFQQSGYRVFGIIARSGPVQIGRRHMWKAEGEE